MTDGQVRVSGVRDCGEKQLAGRNYAPMGREQICLPPFSLSLSLCVCVCVCVRAQQVHQRAILATACWGR